MTTKMNQNRGFTLVELMIVIAIIGILAFIAYPAYTNFVKKAHRSAAQQYLSDIASRQEQYRLDARTYGTKEELGVVVLPDDVLSKYEVYVEDVTAITFTIRAKAIVGSVMDGEKDQTINQLGIKTPADEW